MFDGKAFGQQIVAAVKDHMATALTPITARLDALEKQVAAIPAPKDVPDLALVERVFQSDVKAMALELRAEMKAQAPVVGLDDIKALRDEIAAVRASVAEIEPAAEMPDLDAIVAKAIEPHVASVKAATNAALSVKAPDLPDVPGMVDAAVAKAVAALPPAEGIDAIDVEMADDETMVLSFTVGDTDHKFEVALPRGKDGRDGEKGDVGPAGPKGEKGERGDIGPAGEKGDAGADGRDGADGAAGERGETGEKGADGLNGKDGTPGRDGIDGKDGRDGLDVKDLLVEEDGSLVAVFSDGRTKNLGPFRGKDGKAGDKGADGSDGKDGLGFDDLHVEFDGHRTFQLKFERGDQVKEYTFKLPTMLDCGTFELGKRYDAGDGITHGGSYWIATKDGVTEKPGEGDGWRLAVKKGKDFNAPVRYGKKDGGDGDH